MRCSIVIPTYQRRERVLRAVTALERQRHADFEVIVAVDGSTDGTAAALRAVRMPFPLTVVERSNRGAAMARNEGARRASGELLVFLDDDMEADPEMLAEHIRAHRAGAEVVVGHVPLHPDSPPTAIAAVTGRWAERRRRRLEASPDEMPVTDLLTGQMSIARSAFERLGGFDPSFTRGGLFGGEDLDFGYRARRAGLRIAFNASAISYQYYDIDAATYTRRSREVARADQELIARYPELAAQLSRRRRFAARWEASLFGLMSRLPAALLTPVRLAAIALFSRPNPGKVSNRLFFAVQTMEHRRGAREARRSRRRARAVVLAYHAISDLGSDRILREYGVAPQQFATQLDMLAGRGWRFISFEDLRRALAGRGALPRRAALVTFDDGYSDLLTNAAPLLSERGIPALAFAVSDRIGAVNDWEARTGVSTLPLLDAAGLRELANGGIEIGSHGASHRSLPKITDRELEDEVRGSAERLQSCGLPRPRALSYPYGEWDPTTVAAVRAAGYDAAFTVTPGVVKPGQDHAALPRVEVYASDSIRTLRLKLAGAAWPSPLRRELFRRLPGPDG